MLLQSKKELAICGNLCPDDVFFYYTTTFVPALHPTIAAINLPSILEDG